MPWPNRNWGFYSKNIRESEKSHKNFLHQNGKILGEGKNPHCGKSKENSSVKKLAVTSLGIPGHRLLSNLSFLQAPGLLRVL